MNVNHHTDENSERIVLTVNTAKYADAVAVTMKAFLLAEKLQHHPTVTTGYNKVVIEITSHDAGNKVTEKDREYIRELVDQL